MSLRGILHQVMYKDKATVYRAQKVLAEDGSDDYADEFAEVLSNIPCKLSQYNQNGLPTHVEDRAITLSIDLRLCCDPEHDIRMNDIVEVLHRGQKFTLRAGQRFAYPTHQEISMRRKKEAEQDGD